jgi:hypothetical protein
MDLLIDSHCHLIRSTRALLAWGTTLYVAVGCLETAATDTVLEHLARLPEAGLSGSEEHHLGAPKALNDIVTGIAKRVAKAAPCLETPTLGHIYIIALQELILTDAETLKAAYDRTRSPAPKARLGSAFS